MTDNEPPAAPREGRPGQAGLRIRHAFINVIWTGGGNVASRLVSLLALAILTRFVPIEAFGVVAFVTGVIALSEILRDQGFTQALVQRGVITKNHVDSAFAVSLSLSVLMTGVMLIGAQYVDDILGYDGAGAVAAALSVLLPLNGVAALPLALLRREMAFRAIAVRNFVAASAAATVGIGFAVAGTGVWALVAQQVTQATVGLVMLLRVSPFRPGFDLALQALRDLMGFGLGAAGLSVLGVTVRRGSEVLVGLVAGPAALGGVHVAWRIVSAIVDTVVRSIATVSFPYLSRLTGARVRQGAAQLHVYRFVLALTLPAFAGLTVLAEPVIAIVAGARWEDSAGLLKGVSLGGIGLSLSLATNAALLARARLLLALKIQSVVTLASLFALGVGLYQSISVATFAYGSTLTATAIGGAFIAHGDIGGRKVDIAQHLMKVVIATIGMLVAVLFVDGLLLWATDYSFIRLAIGTIAGVAAYTVILTCIDRSYVRFLKEFVRAQ